MSDNQLAKMQQVVNIIPKRKYNTPSNHFLGLPRELRDKIYLMACDKVIRVCDITPDGEGGQVSVLARRQQLERMRLVEEMGQPTDKVAWLFEIPS